jgi:hypothetical protein
VEQSSRIDLPNGPDMKSTLWPSGLFHPELGAQFDTIDTIGRHGAPKNDLTTSRLERIVFRMDEQPERRFVILKYMRVTPSLATCDRCHLKFFTPLDVIRDPLDAEQNLRGKFASHTCLPVPFAQSRAS